MPLQQEMQLYISVELFHKLYSFYLSLKREQLNMSSVLFGVT